MSYRRLRPDFVDATNQSIMGSYIADLNALLRGDLIGNSGTVAERMVFALIRNLQLFGKKYENLIAFLETTLDRKNRPLHIFDGFSDEYLRLRMEGLLHDPAITELAGVRLPELGKKDECMIDATQPDALPIQDIPEYDYRIVSLTVLTSAVIP